MIYHSELCRQLNSSDVVHNALAFVFPLFILLLHLLFKNSADSSRRTREILPTVSLYLVHFVAMCCIFNISDVCKLGRWNMNHSVINIFLMYVWFFFFGSAHSGSFVINISILFIFFPRTSKNNCWKISKGDLTWGEENQNPNLFYPKVM